MLKRISVMCLLVLCICANVCNAETWQYIAKENNTKYYYDSDNIIHWKPTYIEEYNQTLVTISADIKEEETYSKIKKDMAFSLILVNGDVVDIKFQKKKIYLWNYKENKWVDTKEYNEKWYPAKGIIENIALHLYHTYY